MKTLPLLAASIWAVLGVGTGVAQSDKDQKTLNSSTAASMPLVFGRAVDSRAKAALCNHAGIVPIERVGTAALEQLQHDQWKKILLESQQPMLCLTRRCSGPVFGAPLIAMPLGGIRWHGATKFYIRLGRRLTL